MSARITSDEHPIRNPRPESGRNKAANIEILHIAEQLEAEAAEMERRGMTE